MVVDDSLTTCLFIASTLQQAGYQVDIAHKGLEGLAKVMRFQPCCLILDVVLPDISGYAVCRQVQQSMLQNPIHIILISTKNASFEQNYGLRQGANRYLPKPFTAKDLVEAVWEGIPEPLRHTVQHTLSSPPPEEVLLSLSELLPRRVSNQDVMRTNSPFTRTPTIKDEQAYQLYTAIDGKKTLAELVALTGMEVSAVTRATRVLLKEKCIRIYDASGQLREDAL